MVTVTDVSIAYRAGRWQTEAVAGAGVLTRFARLYATDRVTALDVAVPAVVDGALPEGDADERTERTERAGDQAHGCHRRSGPLVAEQLGTRRS
jgi:hypothetical protein